MLHFPNVAAGCLTSGNWQVMIFSGLVFIYFFLKKEKKVLLASVTSNHSNIWNYWPSKHLFEVWMKKKKTSLDIVFCLAEQRKTPRHLPSFHRIHAFVPKIDSWLNPYNEILSAVFQPRHWWNLKSFLTGSLFPWSFPVMGGEGLLQSSIRRWAATGLFPVWHSERAS